jgi:chromatin remodeling complex protein RSC6
MTRFVGTDRLQRTQVLKKVWEYIKANQLQEGRSITHDDTLAELFDYPLDAGQLMKQMGKHMVEKIEGSALPSAKKRGRQAVHLHLYPILIIHFIH